MTELKDAIDKAISTMEQTTALFYQQKNKEGYQLLDSALQDIMQAVSLISKIKTKTNQIQIEEQKLNNTLGNAMKAIEQGDTVLLSDILHFDLRSILIDYCNY